MVEKIISIAAWVVGIVIAVFIVAGVWSFFISLGQKYVIYSSGDVNYTNSYQEKDGCIHFTDYLNAKVDICGAYTIRERNFKD